MERLRLWRYKKLANENVKEPKVNEKLADDEDYSSCFKLRKSLKVKFNLLIYNNAPSRGCQTELNQPPISRGDELIINEAASRELLVFISSRLINPTPAPTFLHHFLGNDESQY